MPRGVHFLLFFLLLASSLQAQSLINQIGWKGADSGIIAGVIAILCGGIVFLSFLYVGYRRRIARDEEDLSRKLFSESCIRAELNSNEISYLEKLLSYQDGLKPHIIFESISIFEKSIDVYVRDFQSQNHSEEEILEEDTVLSSLRSKLGYSFLAFEHPLLSTRNISLGQNVSVFLKNRRAPLAQNCTVIKVAEFYFSIQGDEEQKHALARIAPGTELVLAFTRQCDGVYSVTVPVKGWDSGKLQLFHTVELMRNQMRQYVRMEVNLPMKFRVVESAGTDAKVSSQQFTSRVVEMSGGGLSFFFEKPLQLGDVLLVTAQLPGGALTAIRAKVLRISLLENKSADKYKHHVQFISIDPKNREQIVHFIFEKQRQVNQMR